MAELSRTKQGLYKQPTQNRKLEQEIYTLQSHHVHAADTERQLVGKIAEAELLAKQRRNANNQLAPI